LLAALQLCLISRRQRHAECRRGKGKKPSVLRQHLWLEGVRPTKKIEYATTTLNALFVLCRQGKTMRKEQSRSQSSTLTPKGTMAKN
jgi:hypothetical protein